MPELMSEAGEEEQGMSIQAEADMGESTITVDQIVELLNSTRRRNVLSCMASREEPEVRWDELVVRVTEAEAGRDWDEQERKRVQISLHQNHVPALERAGVVTQRENTEGERYVGKGPHFDVVVRAHKALNEAATNEEEDGGFLGRFL